MEAPSTKDKEQAEAELTVLVERLLHKNLTADEVEYIIEMTKGVNKVVAGKVGKMFAACVPCTENKTTVP
jgi:hypothetical protein